MLEIQALQTAITMLVGFIAVAVAFAVGALAVWRYDAVHGPIFADRRAMTAQAHRDDHDLAA
jgi:hypothetical protein